MIAIALFAALGGATPGRAAFTADVCYGASWEPTATATKASIGKTVKPVTAVPKEHPLFVDAFAKACLDVGNAAGNTSAATTVRLPKRTNAGNELYWSNAAGACATSPTVSAGQLFYNRAEMGSTLSYADSNTGLEKDKTVRIVFVNDDDSGAHVVVLAGARAATGSSSPEVGLMMEGGSLKNSANVVIEEPRGLTNVVTSGSGCDPSVSSASDCYELDTDLGLGKFRWGSGSDQRGIVIGHVADVNSEFAMKFTLLERIDSVEIGSFDDATFAMSWETIPTASALRGFKIRSATCTNHCALHATCASCATDDACGYCSATKTCTKIDGSCSSGFDVIGECLDTCGAALTCGECADQSGCGWCHTTGRCTAAQLDGSAPQDGNCSAFSVGSSAQCATCPGAVTSTMLPAYVDVDRVSAFCNGRGTCDNITRTCTCSSGYGGDGCEKMCPGGASNPCSRNGLCDSASGSCFCNPGYVGSRCNAATIVGTCECGSAHTYLKSDGTQQRVCSGRLDSSGSCVCLEGWSGVNCTVACAGTLTVGTEVCGGHGTCNVGTGQCDCEPCYSRDATSGLCVQDTCSTCDSSNGVCSCVSGSMQCACRGAFDGYACDQCKCGDHGRCNALSGECECDAGYAGELCERLIEPQPTCANGGTWNAALKRCECAGGYTGTLCDAACTTNPCNDLCSGHGTVNVDGTSCTCFTGFSGSTCNACATGYGPYPKCGATLANGECTDNNVAYTGTTNVTISGKQCQSWSSQSPFAHTYASSSGSTSNECRNPSSDAHPWCYVDHTAITGSYTRGEPRWEFCSVPTCKSAYVNPQKICGVFGGETVVTFDKDSTSGALNAVSQQALTTTNGAVDNTTCGAINLANEDITLHANAAAHGDFVARFAEDSGTGYARRIITHIGLKASVSPAHDSVEVHADGTVKVNSVTKTNDLPYSDGSTGVLCVSDWMPVSSGLASTELLQITISETTVANITKFTACTGCAAQLIVVISVPNSVTSTGICATAGSATSVNFDANAEGSAPWGVGAALNNAACGTATHDPGSVSTVQAKWCDQCQYLGEVYDSCVAQMANEGFNFARAAVIEGCRMAFVAIYGYDRTIPSYLTATASTGATLADTVYPYRSYTPSDVQFKSLSDNRLAFDVLDVTETLPEYIVGTTRTDGSRTRMTGLPREFTGETDTTQVFPFPRIEDSCRTASDIGSTSGYRVYTMNYASATDEALEITMCGSATGTNVGVYTKDFVDIPSADWTHHDTIGANGDITFTFTPWIDGLATYEARFEYSLASTKKNVTFDVTRTSANVNIGSFEFYPPTASDSYGSVGFEFSVPSAEAAATVSFTMSPTGTGDSTAANSAFISLTAVFIHAKNYAQASLNYPPFGGFKQVSCANFQAASCGSLKFTATQKTYYIVVSGQKFVSGAYSMQIKKLSADLTTVYTVSSNAATSLVRPLTGLDGAADGTLTPYKVAKYGDNIRVVVRASHAIDRPRITLGNYAVPSSKIVSAGAGAEYSATVTVSASMATSGHITVKVEQASTLTSASYGFKTSTHPLGSDIALVVLDNTAPTVSHAWVVNPSYMLAPSSAPSSCTDLTTSTGKDVNVTAAKYAKAGDYIAVIFTPSENVATIGGTIGGQAATKWVRATAPRDVTLAIDAYKIMMSAAYVDAAYALVNDITLSDGVLPFSITFTDAVGNVGTTINSAINSLTGVTASSPLADRLSAARLLYDKSPPRPDSWSLSYASSSEMTGNQGSKPVYYHGFDNVASSAKEYRIGDTLVLTGTWTEYVSRPYGAYMRSSASSGVHVPQSAITITEQGGKLTGKLECMAKEFRPRAQEAVSTAQGFGGTSYVTSTYHKSWKVEANTIDPCDIVGKGALAWSARADCQAEHYAGNSLWIPLWSAWCRHGWGTLGYAVLGGVDPAGNSATALRQVSKSPNNADATVVIASSAVAGDAIIRTPIPIAGKIVPSWMNSVPRGDWTADPKVIEVYIEPQNVRWNEYRRVVKVGDMLQIQFYTDQPVKGVRALIGNDQALPAATHSEVASAMNVERPCSSDPDMQTWLGARGLLALAAEEYNDGSQFSNDDDWFDWLVQTSYNYRQPVPNVPNYPNAAVTCTGFWVQRGLRPNGKRYSVRRLCPNRYYLRRSSFAAQAPLTCSDPNDRIYKATDAYNYWVINFRYVTSHQVVGGDGALQIKWQLTTMDDRVLPTGGGWQTSAAFFTSADNSTDVNHLKPTSTDAVGAAFDPAISCGRNADTAFNQAGSAVWAVQDTLAPSCASFVTDGSCASTTVARVANSSGTTFPTVTNPATNVAEHVAVVGDYITLIITFDEHIAAGVYVTLNDVLTARATKVDKYSATFTFEVTQTLAALNTFLEYKVYNLKDIQEANTATATFTTNVFNAEKIRLQSASELTAFSLTNGACSTTSNNVNNQYAKNGNTVNVSVTLPLPPSSANTVLTIHESKLAGVYVTPPTPTCVGTPNACTITMARTVDSLSADFVDGSVVSWSLVVIGTTKCAHDASSLCITRFKLTSCRPTFASEVVLDFTPPSLTSVRLSEPVTSASLVKDTGQVKVDVVSSEQLYTLTYTLDTRGPLCTYDFGMVSAQSMTLTTDGTLTGTHTKNIAATYNSASLHCVLEVICITFVGEDMAGHKLTNPTTCRSFSPTDSEDYPGWFMLHNVGTGPSSVSLARPLGLHCMDSSVDTQACANSASVTSTTLEYGNYLALAVSSGYPIGITDISVDGNSVYAATGFGSSTFQNDNAWTIDCSDLVRDDLCVRFATSATCQAYLCPTCQYAGMCDFSCGYCDSRRAFSKTHKLTLKTTDFGLPATDFTNKVTVSYRTNPAIAPAATISSADTLTYTAPTNSSCAGRCGGTAPSGCECNPTCKSRGTCCADAGHCCTVGLPSTGALNVDGGCLRPNAVTLSVTKESWGVDTKGVRKSYVNRYSTIYIKLTGNKPIDVRRVLIGGVLVPDSDVAIEYNSQTSARQSLNEALVAYGNGNDAQFTSKSAAFAGSLATLPSAAYSWDGNEFSIAFPDIPSTLVATIRVNGANLVPQPDGALTYEVVYRERSGAPYFTDNAELTLTGTGPTWLNPPSISSVSYVLLPSGSTCDLSTPGTPVTAAGNGLTKIEIGHQLRTVVTFSSPVVVRKWTVEGAETNCYGTCHLHGLCKLDPHILPPDEHDEAEYITTWTSCRTFDAKEMTTLENLECGVREFIRAVDRSGNLVMGERWNNLYCFTLPPAIPSQGLIKVRGLTSCYRSTTTKKFGPGCIATIHIEADGEIMEPTVKWWNTATNAYANFPPACVMAATDPTSPSSLVWTLTCAGTAAAIFPPSNSYTLQLEVSDVRATDGSTFNGTARGTDDGYLGSDKDPIIVDNLAPTPTATVPLSCALVIGSQSTITVTYAVEPSWRPTVSAFGAQVGGVIAQTGALSGFHTVWIAPITVPSDWLGGSPMPFVITNGEDEYGNIDTTSHGNYLSNDNVLTGDVNCSVNVDAPRVTSATCASPSPRVVKPGGSVTVDFSTNVAVTIPSGCVKISGVTVTPTDLGGSTSWRATATIPSDPPACDGEVALSICAEITDTGTNTGVEVVTQFFGPESEACLIDGTAPVLQLIDFTSDNTYDSKLATVGDTVRLYFEASEMITAPTITLFATATPSATAVETSGPSRRRFPSTVLNAGATQYATIWTAEYVVDGTTPVGALTWDATGFMDRATNDGTKSACADWNPPSCSIVHAAQTTAQRALEPSINFVGDVVQTFNNFLTTSPSGNVSTLFSCYANSSSTSLSALNLATLKTDLSRHDIVAGGIFQHHLMTAQDLWWQRGGACGTANGLMCRSTCGRCNDAAVVVHRTTTTLTVANVTAGGTAIPGDQCPGGVGTCMCNPTLGDQSEARYIVSTSARDLVSKPTIRFTDTSGTVYTVPEANIVAVSPVMWPTLPTVDCLSESTVRDGVCDPSATLNNRDGCWDGGDCCQDTCRQVFSDGAYCQAQDCRDHSISPVTGRPTSGFWSSYNAKALVARELSVEWKVTFPVDDTLPLIDGVLTGTACCMQDKSGLDVLHANKGTFVAGAPCLDAVLTRDTSCLLRAALTADNGEFVVKENQPVSLTLEFEGNPRGMNCTIGGESVTMTQTRNASSGVTALWSTTRTSVNAVDTAIATRIAASEEQKRRHELLPEVFELNLWANCSRGVTIPFECSISDCGGNLFEITDAVDPTSDVCFDYVRPDATSIGQTSSNTCSNAYAKVGDTLILNVTMDADVSNPTAYTLAGEACTLTTVGTNAFTCDVVVSSTTIEGPANFTFDGIKSSVPAYLDAVNTSYTELKTLSPDGVVTLGGDRVIIDRTAPTFDSLAMYSLEVANKTCQKRCTVRVAIDAAEELSSCTATIGGITANITGTGSERVAEAYIDENSGVAAGEITFSVICLDLACNSVTTSTLVGDTDAVIYSLDRDIPLEVLFYSDRPGHLEIGNENDCLMMEMRFLLAVELKAIVMGNITNNALSLWNITTTGGALVVPGTTHTYYLITHCITDAWGTEDWPVVPWSFTYDDGLQDVVWNTTFTSDVNFPRVVRLDLEDPVATYVYAFTTGANDPSAGLGDALYLDIIASEAVVAPTVTFGGVTLNATDVSQVGTSSEWRAGPYIVKNSTDDPNILKDISDCFLFSVTLKDLVDHTSILYSQQVNATGSLNCVTQRVDIDQDAPTIVWLQTEYVTATTVDFTFAVDELSNVSYVVLPRGAVEPTPLEVQAGTGAAGTGAVASGVKEYLGSSTPSPGAGAGGKGQDVLNITGLLAGTNYDVWFVPFDRFGNSQTEAQSRWIRTVGLDMLINSLATQEGGYTDVIQVKLTQVPTADVSVTISERSGIGNVVLVDQALSLTDYVSSVTLVFTPITWNVAQEVGVKAVDDIYVEDQHTEELKFDVRSLDVRYDALVDPNRTVVIADNDECGVIVYDPNNRPLERTLSCSANAVIALLNYSVAEDTTVYADIYLQAAVRGDDVRVTLTSSDLTQISSPASVTLTFNETNYNLAQRVPIIPVYSCVAALDRYVPIAVSVESATTCGDLVVPEIPVYVTDLQKVGLAFTKAQITGPPGSNYEFDMYLTSQPTSDVQVSLATLPDAFGADLYGSASFNCGAQGPVWTFSADECSVPVTCIVTLVGDDTKCGDVTLQVGAKVTSLDSMYNGISSSPPNMTILETANAAGWYIRNADNTEFIVTPPDAPNGTLPLEPWKVNEQIETGIYTITPTTALCKTVTLRPYIPDTDYARYATISPRQVTLEAGFFGPTKFKVIFPRNYNVPVTNDIVQIWHDVVYGTDDPDYLALSPNLGGSALPVEIVEYDVAGLLLGNGAENTVLIDEPCSTDVTTQVSSLGFTLSSAPSATVVVSLSEMNYNATQLAILKANKHLVLGTTSLSFTPNNWNIPQPVMVSAISYDNLTEARTAYVCGDMTSDDDVYQALNQTCYPVHICDCSGSCGLISFDDHANCTFAADQLNNTEITFPPSMKQLSSCWNISATCGGIQVASLSAAGHDPVMTNFTTLPDSEAYAVSLDKVQRLFYTTQWSVIDKLELPLSLIDGGMQGLTDASGTYCLGISSSSFVVNNTANGGLFVEKAAPMSAFANSFEILPAAANTFDSDVYILEVSVLAGASPLTDSYSLNCTDGGNFSAPGGCIIGPSLRGYFNNATQVMTFTNTAYLPEADLANAAGRKLLGKYPYPSQRRRLLQAPAAPAPASTSQFVWAVNNITFSDISLDPTGATRMMNTRVVDQFGAIVEGPILNIDTEGVNDPPIIDIDLPLIYTEKESLTLNAPLQAYDVDNYNWTQCVVNITDIANNFMAGDTFSYNKTAIVEYYQYWNTSLPAGFVDIDATFTDSQRTVTFAGLAPPAAYLRAMRNLVLLNAGPAMTADDRYIMFCCQDPEALNNKGCGLQRVVFQPVNDPPLAENKIVYLADPRVGGLTGETVPGSDPDGDTFTFNISCLPNKGDLTFNTATGQFDYAPYPNMIGDDRFVYFTWDGYTGPNERPLQSKYATVEIRIGNGETNPVAQDINVDVWENSAEYFTFSATDADSTNTEMTNDILRYQIFEEPELNVAGIQLDTQQMSGGKRYSENATFQYTAFSSSDLVRRVSERMANYGTNFDFNTLARENHPGFNVTSFKYVAIDLSGRVSNVANAWVWVRLTSETNSRPSANAMTFTTPESVGVASNFDTADSESPLQLRHTLPSLALQPTLGVAAQVGIAASPYGKAFTYEPFPFYYGVDVFEYLVTDPHGSTSDLTTITVTVSQVDQPPQGACGVNSTLKSSADPTYDLKGRTAELSVLMGYQIIRAKTMRYLINPERRDLEFYNYLPFINDLSKFDSVIDHQNIFLSCGSTSALTTAAIYHDQVTAVALLAYDVDQAVNDTIRYVLSELPTIASSDAARGTAGYAGTLYRYVAPNGTYYNSTGTTVYSYTSDSVTGLTPLAAGDTIGDAANGAVMLLFKPREYIHGPITFKWHAVDTTTSARGDDVAMTISAMCRGGESVNADHGETCDLCPVGSFNSANIADQQSCVQCPAGSYTSATGSTICVPCPADTYASTAGSQVCTPCPANTRSPSGSDDVSDCLCDIGFVVSNSPQCHPCALDRVKCTELGQYTPLPYDGFWQDSTNGKRNLTCIPGLACQEKFDKDEVRTGACAQPRFYANNVTNSPAYVGDGCSKCAKDHYRYASFCEACDPVQEVRIFFVILAYCVALYAMFELATHPAIPSLTILLSFTQITAQMQYFEIPWPKALARWMQVASLAVADLQILGLDCVSTWDYFTRFATTMFAPFVWVFVLGIAIILRCWREIANQAYANMQRRRLIERRRLLHEFDVDAKKWTDLAIARDGLPFDRPDLKGKGDDYNALELHLYGNTKNEGLRKRVFKEGVEELRKADLRAKSSQEQSKTERKLRQTKDEIEELEKQKAVSARIIRDNVNRAIPSLVIVMWWGYMLLSRTAIEYFECKDNTESVLLVADPQIRCNFDKHLQWKPVALIGFILYPVGLFLAAFGWLYVHRSSSKTRPRVHVLATRASQIEKARADQVEQFNARYGMMYNCLRPQFYLWICVDLGKKFSIVGVKVLFPNDILLQSFVSMVVFVTFGIMSTRNPYVSVNLNVAEMLATFMNSITLIAGFYFQLGIMDDVSTQIATYVIISGLAGTTIVLTVIVVVEFFPWMKRLFFLLKYNTQTDIYKPDKIGTHESGPQGTSCYIFASDSAFRYWCWRTVRHPVFDRLITATVMMSVGCLISESVLYDETFTSSAYVRIVWFNSFINGIFVLEAAVKIIAMGFILGDGAYLRDTFNCIDFLVIMLQFILFAVNITTNVTGARSARFVKFARVAKVRVIRVFRRFLQFNAVRGEKFRLMLLEAKAEDTPALSESIERLRVVFEPRSAETMEYNLRVLQPDVLRVAQGLIDELYQEKFDPELVAVYESQTDAVHQMVQKRYHDIVYEWLAFVAEPGQKRAFLATLKNIRDVALDLGPEGIAKEMLRQKYDIAAILNTALYKVPADVKTDTRAYKRKIAKDAKSFTSTKATISKQFNAFQASMQSDDRVEDALNQLPLHSVEEDSALAKRRAENASVRIRNRSLNASAKEKIIQDDLQQKTSGAGELLAAASSVVAEDDVAPAAPAPVKSSGLLARFRKKKT